MPGVRDKIGLTQRNVSHLEIVAGLTTGAGVGKIGATADPIPATRREYLTVVKNAQTMAGLTLALAVIPGVNGLADG
jgi:hypothetical protein